MLPQGGIYTYLTIFSTTAAAYLSECLSRIAARPLDVVLLHDGIASARARAGGGGGVIMLGTALDVGPPSGEDSVRPLAADFCVRES